MVIRIHTNMPLSYRKIAKGSLSVLLLIIVVSLMGCASGTTKSDSNSTSDAKTGKITGKVLASSSITFKTLNIALQGTLTGTTGVSGAVCTIEGTDKRATTDEHGSFAIPDVAPGSYIVICKKTASDGKVFAFLKIAEVQTGQTTDIGAIQVTQTGSIQGKATLANQTDHTGISVYIPGTSMQAKTDAAGAFLIKDIPEGAYKLLFEKDGYVTASLNNVLVTSGDTTIIVTLDTVSPVLSNIKTSATGTTANISWQTNEATTGKVNFGLNQNYGNPQIDSNLTTNHTVLLTGLSPQTLYHYQIVSTNATGNTTISTDLTFKTDYDPIVNPNISVNIAQPTQGATANTPLLIAVTVNSLYELKDVKARVEGVETNMSFSNNAICSRWECNRGWAGSISLTGLERGEKLLIVKASDVFGNITEATRSFIFDQKPVLSVGDPLDGTVARPQLHISASCTDDDPVGCTSITVKADGTVVATGQSSIDENVSLASFDGRQVTLRFEAKDSANQVIAVERVIYVEASSMLTEVETVSGSIFDVQPDRILFLNKAGADPILKIRNRVTGENILIPGIPGKVPQYGFLTPKGAIFAAKDNDYRLFEWIGNAFATINFPTNNNLVRGSDSLKVSGNYAIWNLEKVLSFRDLLSGTDTIVSDNTGGWGLADVAANGDVVFGSDCGGFDCNIFRYRQGTITRLTNDIGGTTIGYSFSNRAPLTDGINVVYSKKSPPSNGDTYAIAVYGISGEVILSPASSQSPSPGVDYQLNNGWVAFTKSGSGGELQIWVRSPSNQETKITFWGTSSSIGALSPGGEVTFINGNRMYLSGPGLTTIEIGSNIGRSFWQDGQWYVIIGRSLFSISR